ncbi:MAG: type I restriction endonuclease subunit R [Alistipes sp.]|uniref:type I restriction endonuclease subunit R n=1 Tax=Alistipes sp. TaxID=1872444 RepID=UPI0023F2CC24|nr:type I restriction endonuclease subunit R [Alistipes sp.]MBR2218998.1 type I restriction endonuclease subunit R [Alistipes sp.]
MNREKQIEESFIRKLTEQLKYVYRDDIHDRTSLEANFRQKFETLNKVKLSDSEFDRLLEEIINPDVFVSSKRLRERNTFTREDGTPLQYTLVNIKDWCKNDYEVINQLRMNTDNSYHRYDVILLINGIPVVQIELKTYDVSPRRAMQQIVDYKNDPGNGYMKTLLCFIQLFVVSNQTNTYYFTNNNNQHFSFNADEQFLPVYQYATEQNTPVSNLDAFSSAVLTKCELGKMISLYMVLVASEQKLLIMRPYQIYAVKAIMNCVHQNRGNGYIWHTTGSGKTLTSFKASTLMKDNPDIDKCLFVVDRKDLDRQTREEFNKFQENCVEENTNTEMLVRRMLSDDYADKVIVTTIQKLGIALDPKHKKNYQARLKPLKNKRVVFIFDECHRSQFGNNHKAIKEFFPNSQLFGFTGTPIFEKNSVQTQVDGEQKTYKTTEDIFEKLLHAYTITNAIEDNNVLRFHVDYFKPKEKNQTKSNEISKTAIINSILQRHNAATDSRRFNAIMATGRIDDAIEYYNLFKTIQQERKTQNPEYESLNIACIFSPPAEGNKDIQQIQEDLPQERFDNQQEPDKKKAALKMIIADYNGQYGTNHTIAEFDTYYQDVQGRIKSQKYGNKDVPHKDKIDITIVVDMLLTGFDSKYLNTLYTDKDLKWHNLIQAFSRTNRILNDTKPYGNILDFRGLEDAVDEAIAMFSEKHTDNPKQIWLVDPAPKVIEKYEEAISQLEKFMQSHGLECKPEEVNKLRGDEARAGFINCFKEVQRFRMRLEQYTDIQSDDKAKIDSLMQEDTLRAFKGIYIDTARRMKKKREKRGGEQVSQQIENLDFEFILFASAIIDYDYIMGLIARYTNRGTAKNRITKEQLITLVASSANLMEEKEDIVAYINSLDEINGKTEQEIKDGYEFFKEEKYKNEITSIATKYGLEFPALDAFVKEIVEREIFDGERLSDLLAPLGLGWKARTQKELALMDDLVPMLKRLADGHEISGLSAYEN